MCTSPLARGCVSLKQRDGKLWAMEFDLSTPVKAIPLSTRALHLFANMGKETAGDVLATNPIDFHRAPGCGKDTFEEIVTIFFPKMTLRKLKALEQLAKLVAEYPEDAKRIVEGVQ